MTTVPCTRVAAGPYPHPVDDNGDLGLADELYDVIGLLRRRSRRLVGAPLPHLALSGAQLELVRVVRRNPGITVAESARVLGLAANTVSTLVGQLVALEVVVRERDDADRRVVRLELTPTARDGLERWRDRRAQSTALALATLDAVDRERLARALPTIAHVAASLPDCDAEPTPEPTSDPTSDPTDTPTAEPSAARTAAGATRRTPVVAGGPTA